MKNEITNARLFDLVRFMRAELHQAELITDDEYVWLCADAPLATSKNGGSPSPRRLEDYDELRKRLDRTTNTMVRLMVGVTKQSSDGCDWYEGIEHDAAGEAREILNQ